MRFLDRTKALLQSVLLPVAAFALLALFTVGSVTLGANDRAIVWAEGTPGQLQEMSRRVSANPWFKHGRERLASEANPRPLDCAPDAREFSFGSLGEFEGQSAREILELMAAEAGARACLSNVFIINELPDRASQSWAQQAASTMLGASLLPLALVVFTFVALADRMKLGSLLGRGSETRPFALAWGVATGAGVSLALALGHWLDSGTAVTPGMTVENVGYPLAFTLVFAVPVIEEVAFRGWMIPLAERGAGSVAAALGSSVLYMAASLPADAWSASGSLLLGLAYSTVYLRTRSVPACIVANVTVSATSFCMN